MADLIASYTGDTTYYTVPTGTNISKRGMVFLCSGAYTIDSVQLEIYRSGTPGTVNIELYAVDGSNHPTGPVLSSGTINGDTLTTSTNGWFYSISMSSYAMSASTKYAIVLDPLNVDESSR